MSKTLRLNGIDDEQVFQIQQHEYIEIGGVTFARVDHIKKLYREFKKSKSTSVHKNNTHKNANEPVRCKCATSEFTRVVDENYNPTCARCGGTI